MALLPGLGLLTGCVNISSTAQYYVPYDDIQREPLPPKTPVPILGKPPTRPYKTIGKLAFTSNQGFPFMRRSMEYNARQAGADAVILHNVESTVVPYSYYIPPSTRMVPIVGYGSRRGKHHCQDTPVVRYYPMYQPGYWVNSQQVMTSIDSEMIVYKKDNR